MSQDDIQGEQLPDEFFVQAAKAAAASKKEKNRLEQEVADLKSKLKALESSSETRHFRLQIVGKGQVPGTEVDGYRVDTGPEGLKYIVALQSSGKPDDLLLQALSEKPGVLTVCLPAGSELVVTELVRK